MGYAPILRLAEMLSAIKSKRMNLTRSSSKLDPEIFRILFDLIQEIEWISSSVEGLVDCWNLCDTQAQQDLILDLVKRIEMVTSKDLKILGERTVRQIVDEWNCDSNTTYLVAVSDDYAADGSQFFLQNIKNKFSNIPNWKERNFKNSIGAIHGIPNGSTVILLDDFIGTGKTIIRKYDWAKNEFKVAQKYKVKLKVVSIAGMALASDKLDALGIDYYFPIKLEKGISEYYQGNALKKAIRNMELLEQKLSTKYNNLKLRDFNFGYGKSEALYCVESTSVPNNVFPLFWWPLLVDKSSRITIFQRLQ
ncbi:MAG: hypothetical protein KDC34_16490 [Saprospiraceae bacterium]|nr:hypothetical protein [Saprospiraceae bacterium]